MSILLDCTKKLQKNEKKNKKIIIGSELSEANNEPTFRIHQKIDKKSKGQHFFLNIDIYPIYFDWNVVCQK